MGKVLIFILLLPAISAFAADKKGPPWVEVRSKHFVIFSETGEKNARRTAADFERLRLVFQSVLPHAFTDSVSPIDVLLLKNQKSFNSLAPRSRLSKGSLPLAGLFLRGDYQNYIMLHSDSGYKNSYTTIFHEYTHFVTRKADWIPAWLSEGLAEFYQNTDIEENDVLLGRPDVEQLSLLRTNELIPLPVFLSVNYGSFYYRDKEKGPIFYAEAWALTHMLLMDDAVANTHKTDNYIQLLERHDDPATAAQIVFGDLSRLQQRLDNYISQDSYKFFKIKSSFSADESSFIASPMSWADVDAVRATVLLRNDRVDEAKPLLNRAIGEEPENILALEALGSYCHQTYNVACADKWFSKAVQADDSNYMTHFLYANTVFSASDRAFDSKIESNLRTTIRLKPDFAPAYSSLAHLFAARDRNLEEADDLCAQAMSIDPGEVMYRIQCSQILMEHSRYDEAISLLKAALSTFHYTENVEQIDREIARDELYRNSQMRQK